MDRLKGLIAATRLFFREVVGELKKVVWPTPVRLAKLTGVVVGLVAIVMLFVFIVDFPLGLGLEKLVVR